MHDPRLVIFDCDGVLVDSEPISNGVLADMLSAEGLTMTLRQARAMFQGLLLDEVLQRAERALGRALAPDWLQRYERVRADAFRASLLPVDGAREAIAACRAAGVGVCVASQGKLEKTRLSLQLTGLAGLLPEQARFSAHQVARGKPHPDLFLHAAVAMGSEPERCVVVEDTPSGAWAGAAAGMRVVGYAADGDAEALRAAGAHTLLWSLRELPAALGLRAGTRER